MTINDLFSVHSPQAAAAGAALAIIAADWIG